MSNQGYLPHHIIKSFVFWILTICVAAATLSAILRSWGSIGELMASRCLWTAFILSLGSVAFLIINCLFGDLSWVIMGSREAPPKIDPAFSERLKQAKTEGKSDGRTD
jgi:hypothetical protein